MLRKLIAAFTRTNEPRPPLSPAHPPVSTNGAGMPLTLRSGFNRDAPHRRPKHWLGEEVNRQRHVMSPDLTEAKSGNGYRGLEVGLSRLPGGQARVTLRTTWAKEAHPDDEIVPQANKFSQAYTFDEEQIRELIRHLSQTINEARLENHK